MASSEPIEITFTTPASAPIVQAFLRRPDVAALAQRENIVFKIDSVELDMTGGVYQGHVKPVSPLADVGAAVYPQHCLVIGDDVMVNYNPGFGDRLLNVVTFDSAEVGRRVQKQIEELTAVYQFLGGLGITRDKDIERILLGPRYETLQDLKERVQEILSAIQRIEEEVDIPDFHVPSSARRAILKTYLINRARP